MWNIVQQIPMIRYLLVLRINSPIVQLPACLPSEISLVLGTMIAERQPVHLVRPWRKKLALWETRGDISTFFGKHPSNTPPPDASWPIETVWFVYPRKQHYKSGEKILCELKMFGDAADHGFFLEVILPVLEAAGYKIDMPWNYSESLWGHFEIRAVYAARGMQWEPFVQDGRLDLKYRATGKQWYEGMDFDAEPNQSFQQMNWVTPFDMSMHETEFVSEDEPENQEPPVPQLKTILKSTIERIGEILPGKTKTKEAFWKAFDKAEGKRLGEMIDQAAAIKVKDQNIVRPPKTSPGQGIGRITFNAQIPGDLLPLLELASIVHIGRQTHLGCGTFYLT